MDELQEGYTCCMRCKQVVSTLFWRSNHNSTFTCMGYCIPCYWDTIIECELKIVTFLCAELRLRDYELILRYPDDKTVMESYYKSCFERINIAYCEINQATKNKEAYYSIRGVYMDEDEVIESKKEKDNIEREFAELEHRLEETEMELEKVKESIGTMARSFEVDTNLEHYDKERLAGQKNYELLKTLMELETVIKKQNLDKRQVGWIAMKMNGMSDAVLLVFRKR